MFLCSSTSSTGGVEVSLAYNVTIKGCTQVVTCDELALAATADEDFDSDTTEITGCKFINSIIYEPPHSKVGQVKNGSFEKT